MLKIFSDLNYPEPNALRNCWKTLFALTDRLHELCSVAPELAGQLTLAQARVVKVIYTRAPEPVILKEIAEELGITPSAVSQTVDWLVREDIVERLPSPTDRRAVVLRPTRRGNGFRQEHDRKISALMEYLLAPVPDGEAKIFLKVLAQLKLEADGKWRELRRCPPPDTPAPDENQNKVHK